jgi:hypothetical protein
MLDFDANELSRLQLLRQWTAKLHVLKGELDMARKWLPKTEARLGELSKSRDQLAVSQAVAFEQPVQDLFRQLQQQEFLRGTLVTSKSRLSTETSVLEASIKCEISEIYARLKRQIMTRCAGDARGAALRALNEACQAGVDVEVIAGRLLAHCQELGARLPQVERMTGS